MTKRQRFLVFCLWTLMLIGLSQIGSLANQNTVAIWVDVRSNDVSGCVRNSSGASILGFSGGGVYEIGKLAPGQYTIEWSGGARADGGYISTNISRGRYRCVVR